MRGGFCAGDVRYWSKADMKIGGKNVRLVPKSDIEQGGHLLAPASVVRRIANNWITPIRLIEYETKSQIGEQARAERIQRKGLLRRQRDIAARARHDPASQSNRARPTDRDSVLWNLPLRSSSSRHHLTRRKTLSAWERMKSSSPA